MKGVSTENVKHSQQTSDISRYAGEHGTERGKERRIVFVCDLLSTFVRFRLPLAKRVWDMGHQVTILSSEFDCDYRKHAFFGQKRVSFSEVPMNRTGMNPLGDLQYLMSLRKHLAILQPDHILVYQAKASVWTALAARSLAFEGHLSVLFPGLGYLFSVPTTLRQKLIQFVSRRLYRVAFSEANSVIFQNKDDFQTLSQFGILKSPTKVHFVNGSGVDTHKFVAKSVPTSPIRFVMATRLLAEKGIREFVTAARIVIHHEKTRENSKGSNNKIPEFWIAGSFDTAPNSVSRQEIQDWHDEGVIHYAGHVEDMVDYLGKASVFVLPSYYMEGLPRSALEAMASGRPILTTNHRGCRETVEDGVNGILVETRDPSSLANAMLSFLESPQKLHDMGVQSRRFAEEKFNISHVCDQMICAMGLSENSSAFST